MKAVRTTCVLVALAFLVQAFGIVSSQESANPEPSPSTTAVPTSGTTNSSITTVTPKPTDAPTTPITTTTLKPTTTSTTAIPTTTVTPTKPTTTSTTTSTPTPTTTSTTAPTSTTSTTTATPPTSTATPCPPEHRHFDGPSFIGGIILTIGLVAIGFILAKFYKARTERNYHTL